MYCIPIPKIVGEIMESNFKAPQMLDHNQFLRLPSQEREQYLREILRKTMKMNPNGITISKITDSLPIGQRTISKHLSIMEYTNEVYTEKIGNTTVYYPNTRLMHPASEKKFDLGNIEFQAYIIRNKIIGDSVFIQETKKSDYSEDIGSGIMIPVDKFKDFVNFLSNVATGV